MIVATGISLVDIILVMDGFPAGEGSYHCDRMYTDGGGMAATALCAAARLGSRTRLVSRVGDDIHGRFVLGGLAAFGVDTSGVTTVVGRNTTVSIIHVDVNTGEKQFYSEFEKSAYLDPITADTGLLDGADVLLLDGHWTDQALIFAHRARERDIPVVSDFKRMYRGLEDVFPLVNYHILPYFFAAGITAEHTPEKILRKLSRLFGGVPVITRGSDGGSYLYEGEVCHYRAFQPTPVVDSTGAGDAFHGAFCHFLEHGEPLDRCLELASAAGALNCRAHGGRAGLPTRDELSLFLAANGALPLASQG